MIVKIWWNFDYSFGSLKKKTHQKIYIQSNK